MKLHHTSSAALPGLEVDEAGQSELDRVISRRLNSDVVGYAMQTENKALIMAIKTKEQQSEKKKGQFYSLTSTRKTSYR